MTLDRARWKLRGSLVTKDEPLSLALIKYRMKEDRFRVDSDSEDFELISSHLPNGKHAPIIDLDFDHEIINSSTSGHHHLVLNVPIAFWRLVILLIGLRVGKVIEQGFFWWSLRRGATFARREGTKKTEKEKAFKYSYGLFFRLKHRG